MNTTTNNPLTTGNIVRIAKGCAARDVRKGSTATITVTPLGSEYSYVVNYPSLKGGAL